MVRTALGRVVRRTRWPYAKKNTMAIGNTARAAKDPSAILSITCPFFTPEDEATEKSSICASFVTSAVFCMKMRSRIRFVARV
jgi:hypothetical protein